MTAPQPQYEPGDRVLVTAVVVHAYSPALVIPQVAVTFWPNGLDPVYVRAADVHPVPPTPDTRDAATAAVRALPRMEPATSSCRDEDWADGYNDGVSAARAALDGVAPAPSAPAPSAPATTDDDPEEPFCGTEYEHETRRRYEALRADAAAAAHRAAGSPS